MLHYTNVLFPGEIDEKDIATFENEQGIRIQNLTHGAYYTAS